MNNQNLIVSLIRKTASGDRGAFEELYVSKRRVITLTISRHSRCHEDIEDIGQAVALRLFRNIAFLRQPEAFDIWLQTIIVHECYRHFATIREALSLETIPWVKELLIETNTDYLPYESVIQRELYANIHAELTRMPETTRQILALHFVIGMGYRKIAEQMGIPTGTVSSILFRARTCLRKAIVRR